MKQLYNQYHKLSVCGLCEPCLNYIIWYDINKDRIIPIKAGYLNRQLSTYLIINLVDWFTATENIDIIKISWGTSNPWLEFMTP